MNDYPIRGNLKKFSPSRTNKYIITHSYFLRRLLICLGKMIYGQFPRPFAHLGQTKKPISCKYILEIYMNKPYSFKARIRFYESFSSACHKSSSNDITRSWNTTVLFDISSFICILEFWFIHYNINSREFHYEIMKLKTAWISTWLHVY